ncbi:phosphate acyltransferase PlsX [Larsenimonas salina]|uniref:phosphate acyltransferase PlsX n=1 Tax=Larsenimonas salina TaxID=1295565 RepID=UPI0020740C95|nr:phosphate acyltransferase PlsX [Larsenimonas salina]
MRIAVDAMGGDLGPRATVEGVAHALSQLPGNSAVLHGPSHVLDAQIDALPRSLRFTRSRLQVSHADAVVHEADRPSQLLRTPEETSLHRCLMSLARDEVSAAISGGNTGALMVLARRYIGMSAGLERPAISCAVPTEGGGRCYLLDLGANVDSSPEMLVQFAHMGAAMASVVDGMARPRVALLNVGVESSKGAYRVRQAHVRLSAVPYRSFEYTGFVEGGGMFAGDVDVVVCDGDVGNAVLKSSEGLARMLGKRLQHRFEDGVWTRIVSFMARPALTRFHHELDPVRYNGASFLGLAKTVVKSHGSADARGFSFAVQRAFSEAKEQLPQRLASRLLDV